MISSGGENIFPDEIEATYAKMPGLDNMVVVGVPDQLWGSIPVAVVTGVNLSMDKLRQYGRDNLAHYKVPKHFYIAETWYHTASGKTQRHRFVAVLSELKELK